MSDTTRCEPPEELRGVDGWHVLYDDGEPELEKWHAAAWWDFYGHPSNAMRLGITYGGPFTPPAEVAALRAEVERLRAAARDITPPPEPTNPAEGLSGTEHFKRCIADNGHTPTVHGKYAAAHPQIIRAVYEEARTRFPAAADVIAALVFWRALDRTREVFLASELKAPTP